MRNNSSSTNRYDVVFYVLSLFSQSKCVFHRYQDKLPELVVLTAASAKLVAKVFIRAGQLTQEGGALQGSFVVSAPKVVTSLDGQPVWY